MNALLFGASGGLATAIIEQLLKLGWHVDLVSRKQRAEAVEQRFDVALKAGCAHLYTVSEDYLEFYPQHRYNVVFFLQALFKPSALIDMDESRISAEVMVGLTGHILLVRRILAADHPSANERRNICFIGSTSAYAGFKNTVVYCAVKHGVLGLVRALNDEYRDTDTRFWLFSMGTMNTEMGATLADQDPSSFLQPEDVAARIVSSISSESNLFEPEVIMRRRTIRFKENI